MYPRHFCHWSQPIASLVPSNIPYAGAVYNKQILSSRTVQRQAEVVLFGHGICLHFDPPCRLQDVPW